MRRSIAVKADMKVLVPMDIDLTKDQKEEFALQYLYELYDWEADYFISEENVYTRITYHSHNVWDEILPVRPATDDDYVIASLLLKIKNKQ